MREMDLEGEDDDLFASRGPLQAGVSVRLEAGEGRERDLLLPRVLRAPPDPRARMHANKWRETRVVCTWRYMRTWMDERSSCTEPE